jgi:hypothetical protein
MRPELFLPLSVIFFCLTIKADYQTIYNHIFLGGIAGDRDSSGSEGHGTYL